MRYEREKLEGEKKKGRETGLVNPYTIYGY